VFRHWRVNGKLPPYLPTGITSHKPSNGMPRSHEHWNKIHALQLFKDQVIFESRRSADWHTSPVHGVHALQECLAEKTGQLLHASYPLSATCISLNAGKHRKPFAEELGFSEGISSLKGGSQAAEQLFADFMSALLTTSNGVTFRQARACPIFPLTYGLAPFPSESWHSLPGNKEVKARSAGWAS
jgi:hypothetical protein